MKTFDADQIPKIERPWLQPRYFVHIIMPGEMLYFSDRNFTYNGHRYENYLTDIPETMHGLEDSGGYQNVSAQLTFKNRPFRAYNSLIEFFLDNPLMFCEADIFVLYLTSNAETFGSDVSTKLHRVVLGEFKSIKRNSFMAELSSIIHSLEEKEIFKRINTDDWPNADPGDIGKLENHIYGQIRDVPCQCVVTGAASSLFLDLTISDTTIILSEVDYPIPFPSSGTIQIDDEKITYTGKSSVNKTLTGCTRGASGTSASIHTRGTPIYLVIATYKYLIAGHVCKSAANAKSDQLRLDPADYTINLNDGAKTTISFTEKQILRIQGMHSHAIAGTFTSHPTSGEIWREVPAKWLITGVEGNIRDQSDVTYARLQPLDTQAFSSAFIMNFPSLAGSIKRTYACITHQSSNIEKNYNTGVLYAYYDGGYETIGTPDYSTTKLTQKFLLTTTKQITSLRYVLGQNSAFAIDVFLYEMWLEIEIDQSGVAAAEGVYGSPADVISPPITIDVEGYQDDASGTYTGTPNALIENPSDVRRHFLVALLGRAVGEIGASFTTARSDYAARISGGYKFGLILSGMGEKPSQILKRLDEQSRSNTSEEGGKFELKFHTSIPPSVLTLSEDKIIGEPIFDQTKIFDIRDKVRAIYDIDWANSSIFTGWKFGRYKKQTQKGTGTRILDVEFPAIQVGAMADDVADWLLIQHGTPWPTIDFTCNRAARLLEKGDPIEIDYMFWGLFVWKVLQIKEIPQRQVYSIVAKGIGYIGFILLEDEYLLLQEDTGELLI